MKTTIILFLLSVPVWAALAYVVFLIIKALRKYIRSEPLRQEKAEQAKTLGETLKRRRTACKMTQEFVAEALGFRLMYGDLLPEGIGTETAP